MHESARFASRKNVELYSYLVVTSLPVSSVRHHCQHVLSAGNLSLALLGLFCHKSRKQQCNIKFNVQSSLSKECGCCGWPAVLPARLGFDFWTAVISDVTPPHCFQHFRHPHLLHIVIKRAQNLCLYEGLKGFFCILYHGRCRRESSVVALTLLTALWD